VLQNIYVYIYILSWVGECERLHKVLSLRYVAIGLTITPLSYKVVQNLSNFIMKYEIVLSKLAIKSQ